MEASFGTVNANAWASSPGEPIDWRNCLTVALHLTAPQTLSYVLLNALKSHLVSKLFFNF